MGVVDFLTKNVTSIIIILSLAFFFDMSERNKIKRFFAVEDLSELKDVGSVLLVIAHPDDEIMFWTPTIRLLSKYNVNMKVLCLSTGNYYGIGETRKREFNDVSNELKMFDNQILDVPELQDNINIKWNAEIVSQKIEDFLSRNNDIEVILTFDERGVTKHPNHISCYDGIKVFAKKYENWLKENNHIKIYLLESFNLINQYNMILPFLSYLFKGKGFFNWTFYYSFKWMKIYKSQFTFLRKLHVLGSCYSYFNSYKIFE